ncbi:branched-chain amino acid transporter permease [Georgenia sunbinii]|uniref:branched-chain amino acid transporter permease n=1 Tax=Georgenia sunbinii TaxID=3117728 RepID=UPI002F264406
MPDPWYIAAAVLIAAGITWTLRAVPFALLRPLRDSELLAYVGERMPVGVMVILAAYTLMDVQPAVLTSAGPAVAALAVTIGLHLWRRNAILSIFAGTAVFTAISSAVNVL